ncbi:WXG100 family type VII secretion target [Pseudonocardia sediminis]|uniref:ESAT-6-like protein n=1 Tax=Pseudonocardia sediminis TaxID=1397368 RepID=A0A4Q7V4F0_PSEST|nr:WXG100 family type VII secretion target [Pseudonocardia sediminis]RZT88344.1 WXG100 family type VII secretion target [Pseudonocardia sediminis]
MAPTADGFGTTTEEMARAAQHVDAVNESVRAELAGLRGKLEPLAGLWTGRASVEFVRLMQRWDTDAQQLNEALRTIGGALQGSRTSYEQREQDQAQAMSGIASALG